ncbi:hypothetical protein AALP_AA3G292900 [Arabis alpina]|uniref:Uncharacterized protein n=1 Tax=Arabis alpina TaxID=50452 RepID=A0A087HCH0_ARAAL|nr:hypothetical protein AALP_AA3G292900 [Arabis alpina]
MVSGETNKSGDGSRQLSARINNREKEPSVEAAATNFAAKGDIAEVKKMLEALLKEQTEQTRINEATSKELKAFSRRKRERLDTTRLRARVDPHRLNFSVLRTARRNPDDLPLPQLRRESDKSPEGIVKISDGDQPTSHKSTRTEGVDGNRQEPRAPDTQSASGFSKTKITQDTSESTGYSSEEQYRKEGERRALKRSYTTELAKMRVHMERVASDLMRTQSQIHHGTGKAPTMAHEMSINTPTTIQDALHRAADFARTKEEVRARKGGKAKQASEPTHATNPAYIQYEGGTWNNTWTRETKEYDEKLYCDFHKASGHSKTKCHELGRQLIAKLTGGTLKGDISLSDFKPEEVKALANTEQQEENPKRQRRNDDPENGDPHDNI